MRTIGRLPGLVILGLATVVVTACTGGGTLDASPSRSSEASPSPAATQAATPSPVATAISSPTPPASPPPTPTLTPAPTETPKAAPTAAPTAAAACLDDPELDAFASRLLEDLASRDEGRIAARMTRRFSFAAEATDVAPLLFTRRDAATSLVSGLQDPFAGYRPLARGSRVRCVHRAARDVAASVRWMLDGAFDAAFLTRGWGPDGGEEAILFLVRRDDGTIAWKAILYSLAGFDAP